MVLAVHPIYLSQPPSCVSAKGIFPNILQWDLITPPRVIEIRSWGNTTTHPLTPIKYSLPPLPTPLTFRISHESRLEALRSHTLIEIGISSSTRDPSKDYIDWIHHPANPFRLFHVRNPPPSVSGGYTPTPYPARRVYVRWDRDTIYLGPEFQSRHLENFLTATGPRLELSGLQYLALDRKLFIAASENETKLNTFLKSLYALRKRPVKEIYVVPDDSRTALDDRFYYCEHEIAPREPLHRYSFRFGDHVEEEERKGFVDRVGEWFESFWNHDDADELGGTGGGNVDEDGVIKGKVKAVVKEMAVPKVEIKSMRRNGRVLASFKDGVWEIQKGLGDMEAWREWKPPTKNTT